MNTLDNSVMERGGEREGIIRMVMALEDMDHYFDRDALFKDGRMFDASSGKRKPNKTVFLLMVKEQSHLLKTDEHMALNALTRLIPTIEGRKRALEKVTQIVLAEKPLSEKQKTMLARMRKILGLQYVFLEKFKRPHRPLMSERQRMTRLKQEKFL